MSIARPSPRIADRGPRRTDSGPYPATSPYPAMLRKGPQYIGMAVHPQKSLLTPHAV